MSKKTTNKYFIEDYILIATNTLQVYYYENSELDEYLDETKEEILCSEIVIDTDDLEIWMRENDIIANPPAFNEKLDDYCISDEIWNFDQYCDAYTITEVHEVLGKYIETLID